MSTDERRRKENLDPDENVGFEPRRDPYSTAEKQRKRVSYAGEESRGRQKERETAGEPVSFNRHLKILEPLLLEK